MSRHFCEACGHTKKDARRFYRPESRYRARGSALREMTIIPEAYIFVCEGCMGTPVEHFASVNVVQDWLRRNRNANSTESEELRWSFWG